MEKQLLSIWRLATSLSAYYRWNPNVFYQSPRRLGLSGTPLNEITSMFE